MVKRRGLTLIELLIAMSITGVVLGIIVLMVSTSLKAWEESEADMAMATAGEQVMEGIAHGLIRYRDMELGLEDALHIVSYSRSKIDIIPSWRERAIPEYDGVMTLKVKRQAGTPPPTAMLPGGEPVSVVGGKTLGDVIFSNKPPPETLVDVYYYPDKNNSKAHLTFDFDREAGKIIRRYAGSERRLPINAFGTKVIDVEFKCFALSEPYKPLKESSGKQIINAVEITVVLQKRGRKQAFKRLTILPNAGRNILLDSTGSSVTVLPPSDKIKVLEIRYLSGAKPGDKIIMSAGEWRAVITFLTKDTASIKQKIAGVAEQTSVAHIAFGISLLNPDIIVDADGSKTIFSAEGSADIDAGALLSPMKDERIRFVDANANRGYDLGEPLFVDNNLNARLDTTDALLLGVHKEFDKLSVKQVVIYEQSMLYVDAGEPGKYNDGEVLVLDKNGDGIWGGPFYDCAKNAKPQKLVIERFDVDAASLVVR